MNKNEQIKTETHGEEANPVDAIVMWLRRWLWRGVKWLIPTLAVVFAIAIAVEWGGVFHREFDLAKSLLSWTAIWCSIELRDRAKSFW